MSNIYGNKDKKKLHNLNFSIIPRRRNSMRFYTVINSLNEDTDFAKIVLQNFTFVFVAVTY